MKKRIKKKSLKKIDVDSAIILGIAGTGAGLGLGNIMTDLKDIKKDTPIISEVHHWVPGVIISLVGVVLNVAGLLKGAGIFLVAVGLGIMLTDLPHFGKQLDNIRDNDPLTEGLTTPSLYGLSPLVEIRTRPIANRTGRSAYGFKGFDESHQQSTRPLRRDKKPLKRDQRSVAPEHRHVWQAEHQLRQALLGEYTDHQC